ncbi:MAG TPA: AAA family ATPase [Streptosporangiaceae bacterium]|nr:AAA family ATPase [Streptosporangiaceae bacterium]
MALTDATGDRAELLERAEQLRELRSSLARVVNGTGGATVLVSGEAGIGKTTLLRRFAGDLGSTARVFWTACDPLFTPRPLGPFVELAEAMGGSSAAGGSAAAQVASGGQAFDVAAALLQELRLVAPAVVVIEDAHWADEATLDVIRLLARRIESVRILLVLSYRDDQLDRAHPLRVVVGELPAAGRHLTRVPLSALSGPAVASLARSRGVDSDQLHERTAGNPFFVTEVLAAETGQVPHSVRDAVLARAARISRQARDLLDAAAVIPGQIDGWMLDALHPAPPGFLDECLSSGVLIVADGRIAFRHEIARQVIEESLPVGQRRMLHSRALSILQGNEDSAPDLARMAHHAEAAGDHAAVLRYAPAAARAAAASGAHREAADLYARALRYSARLPAQERADLLEGFAGSAYLTALDHEGVDRLSEALAIHRSRADQLGEGRTLRELARHLGRQGRHAEGLASALQAVSVLEQIPPGPELALAYVHLSSSYALALSPEAVTWGDKAISLGEEIGYPQAVYDGLNNIGTIEVFRGSLDGVAKLERSRDLAEQAGDSLAVGRAHLHLCWMLTLRGEWDLVARHLNAAIAYCREHGQELWLDQLRTFQLQADLGLGLWDSADQAAEEMLARPEPLPAAARCSALVVQAKIRARRGAPDYWSLLDEALSITKLDTGRHLTASVAAARAEACWLEGRPADALTEASQAQGMFVGLDPLAAADLRAWQWRVGADAGPPGDLPEPYRMLLAGDRTGAARWWQDRASPYEAALAVVDSRDVEELRGAVEVLRGLRARAAVAILARELRSLGERHVPRASRSAAPAHPAGLTGREYEVLQLLAAGMRNADIAARLVVSPRTVDHHVSAVLGKLNARTRGEAIAAAMRLGLVQPESSP